jgi:hypothetical protein
MGTHPVKWQRSDLLLGSVADAEGIWRVPSVCVGWAGGLIN